MPGIEDAKEAAIDQVKAETAARESPLVAFQDAVEKAIKENGIEGLVLVALKGGVTRVCRMGDHVWMLGACDYARTKTQGGGA